MGISHLSKQNIGIFSEKLMIGSIIAQNHGLLHCLTYICIHRNRASGFADCSIKMTGQTQISHCNIVCQFFLRKPVDITDGVRDWAGRGQFIVLNGTDADKIQVGIIIQKSKCIQYGINTLKRQDTAEVQHDAFVFQLIQAQHQLVGVGGGAV